MHSPGRIAGGVLDGSYDPGGPPMRGTVSMVDDGTEEQRASVARMRERGWHVTLWPSSESGPKPSKEEVEARRRAYNREVNNG